METELSEPFLDTGTYTNFAPLLEASSDYAQYSGCRYRSVSFDDLDAQSQEPRCLAKLRAAPTAGEFTQRLKAGDAALEAELEEAFQLLWLEGTRSTMLARCQMLELWPPSPSPSDVEQDDTKYRDMSASLPVIAQRLYNDEAARDAFARRRLSTASFLADFAYEAGLPTPAYFGTREALLVEFEARADDWEQRQLPQAETSWSLWRPWTIVLDATAWVFDFLTSSIGALLQGVCLGHKKLE
eukprot:TRINITY_DN64281_c0_g1_i1.p1 TRINITY_DN64281_c0_g1~~TRINITY_DN64281_c0_g1_i1.p1  ORF type:complete len:242 (-),score=47.44 TRINITY_DN64281_c0_g1_i1:58-783(-)